MALRDMSEKKLIIITIVIALVVAIPCWGLFYFIHDEYKVADKAWVDSQAEGERLTKELATETEKALEIDKVRQLFAQQAKMLPEKDEVSNFFRNDLPNLLLQNNFEIQSLSMQPRIEKEKLPKGVDLAVSYRTIDLRFSGSYQNMIKLLKEIEEGREKADNQGEDTGTYRLFRVNSFDFSPSGEKTLEPSLKHQARIVLHAFFIE